MSKEFIEAGYVFAPYVPLQITPTLSMAGGGGGTTVLRTHEISTLCSVTGEARNDLAPGNEVSLKNHKEAYGIIVSIRCNDTDDADLVVADVLWSVLPDDYSWFTMPMVRRVHATKIAQSLVTVQPMIVPTSSIFYMDYTYGSGSINK